MEKERELKLYQRYLELKRYCEDEVFPLVSLPLQEHVENLKIVAEKIIPEPRDRREEMFSGEIFTLLGTIYLHDMGIVEQYPWNRGKGILNDIQDPGKGLMLSYEIGKNLDIPEMAIEIINYLTYSDLVRKVPIEWEISEDSRRAIVRNSRVIGHIFTFAHLLLDMFSSDLRDSRLRRFSEPASILRCGLDGLSVDSREGIIRIRCVARLPYEIHLLERIRETVERQFESFKGAVNGKLGFQYKTIEWEVVDEVSHGLSSGSVPRFTPYAGGESPPVARWEIASEILDHLFNTGHALVVGEMWTGKSTILKSFVVPQLQTLTENVFYCEVWTNPVNELRDVISRETGLDGNDITSLCETVLKKGPVFLVLDHCECTSLIPSIEKEKFERFIDYCLEREAVYLIVSGNRGDFFDWYPPFRKMNLSSLLEVKPLDRGKLADIFGEGVIPWDSEMPMKPVEWELLKADTSVEALLGDVLGETEDRRGLRSVMAALTDRRERYPRRYRLEDIVVKTGLPRETIKDLLALLLRRDIIKETTFAESRYFALSSGYLLDPVYAVFQLDEFDERKLVRSAIHDALEKGSLLDGDTLKVLRKWQDEMIFSKQEMGVIVASTLAAREDPASWIDKAGKDGSGVGIQVLLNAAISGDGEDRQRALETLAVVQDKEMINPLLSLLERETVPEVKDRIIEAIARTGKKGAMLAVLGILRGTGDEGRCLAAMERFIFLLGRTEARELLQDIRGREESGPVRARAESLLSVFTETG